MVDDVSLNHATARNVLEDTYDLYEADSAAKAFEMLKELEPDLILAVGGGSVCDYAKALSVSIHCKKDPWREIAGSRFASCAEARDRKKALLFRLRLLFSYWKLT